MTKRKLLHVGEGGSAASSNSAGGGAVGGLPRPQAQELSLWGRKLVKTDWGQVTGLIPKLPRVPTGVHSPRNENVLKAFELTPLAEVKAVVIAKVRLLPCVHTPRAFLTRF